jgi:hypothetical protein
MNRSINLEIELCKYKIEKLKRCTGAQNGFNLMCEKRKLKSLQHEKRWGIKPKSYNY